MIAQTDREILVDIHARVKNIETKLSEIDEIERRLRVVEPVIHCQSQIDDHEKRLRVLERMISYATGLAAAIGAMVSFVLTSLKDKLLP